MEEKIEMKPKKKFKFKFKFKKKYIKWIVLLVLVVVIAFRFKSGLKAAEGMMAAQYDVAKIQKQDLEMNISGSGVIEPLDQYSVMPLVQGKIVDAPFEEGQKVKKGDLLYKFSTKDVDTMIDNAELSVQKAKIALGDIDKVNDDLELKSSAAGYIKKLYVSVGDTIQPGAQVADIYDNTTMYLNVPFNAGEVKGSWVGKKATVYAGDNAEKLSGTVQEIAVTTDTLPGSMVVKNVKIAVRNPGGITVDMAGTAVIDGIDCNSEGKFAVKEQKTMMAAASGKIETLSIKEGQYLKKDAIYGMLEGQDVDSQKKNAQITLQEAELNLKSQKNALDNYRIDSPISGQVITKNAKKGDNINAGSATAANGGVMAIIYDLSAVKFEMKVDELDVKSIKKGAAVKVTSEALPGEEMTGYVENISLNSVANNGVTQYPVTVRLDKIGGLLPGMNVEGRVVTSSAKQVDTIPMTAVQRGNIVYIKDVNYVPKKEKKSLTELSTGSTGIPDGFKEVSVEVGINDGISIEIKSGLKPEDEVYIPKPKSYSPYDQMGSEDGGDSESAETVQSAASDSSNSLM